jgi:hypothetical protein
MRLAKGPNGWMIENPGDDRGQVAYASLDGDRVVYEIEQPTRGHVAEPDVYSNTATQPLMGRIQADA